jgi:hypothetical protein
VKLTDLLSELEAHGITTSLSPELPHRIARAESALTALYRSERNALNAGKSAEAEIYASRARVLRAKLTLELAGDVHGRR